MAQSHGTGAKAVAQAALTDEPDLLRQLVARTLQELLEAAMTAHLGAARYERGAGRTGQRNGHRPRALRTRVGTVTLLVPQDRERTCSTPRFARYQRNEQALVLALMALDLEGVSTRKVAEITEVLCGTSCSTSLVSHLAGELDTELAAWRARPLADATDPSLFVDARYAQVRSDGRIISQGVLVVSAIRGDGRREIIAVDVADTESAATYQALCRDLQARGLAGVRLVTSDDHAGLRAASARHFQGASWQRCQVHDARNLLGLVSAGKRKELASGLRQVFAASTPGEARAAVQQLAATWRATHPKVAQSLDEEGEACFACLAFPLAHQARIRTTNGLERFHQELKRRTRVVRIFPNRAACLRLVTALCVEQSDDGVTGRRSLDLAELGGEDTPGALLGREEGAMQLVG